MPWDFIVLEKMVPHGIFKGYFAKIKGSTSEHSRTLNGSERILCIIIFFQYPHHGKFLKIANINSWHFD